MDDPKYINTTRLHECPSVACKMVEQTMANFDVGNPWPDEDYKWLLDAFDIEMEDEDTVVESAQAPGPTESAPASTESAPAECDSVKSG
jgi:hypothetical protein